MPNKGKGKQVETQSVTITQQQAQQALRLAINKESTLEIALALWQGASLLEDVDNFGIVPFQLIDTDAIRNFCLQQNEILIERKPDLVDLPILVQLMHAILTKNETEAINLWTGDAKLVELLTGIGKEDARFIIDAIIDAKLVELSQQLLISKQWQLIDSFSIKLRLAWQTALNKENLADIDFLLRVVPEITASEFIKLIMLIAQNEIAPLEWIETASLKNRFPKLNLAFLDEASDRNEEIKARLYSLEITFFTQITEQQIEAQRLLIRAVNTGSYYGMMLALTEGAEWDNDLAGTGNTPRELDAKANGGRLTLIKKNINFLNEHDKKMILWLKEIMSGNHLPAFFLAERGLIENRFFSTIAAPCEGLFTISILLEKRNLPVLSLLRQQEGIKAQVEAIMEGLYLSALEFDNKEVLTNLNEVGLVTNRIIKQIIKLEKIEQLERLLKIIKPNQRLKDQDTPLHIAIRASSLNAAICLLNHDVDITLRNNRGKTAVSLFLEYVLYSAPTKSPMDPKIFEVLAKFVRKGADFNQIMSNGRTFLENIQFLLPFKPALTELIAWLNKNVIPQAPSAPPCVTELIIRQFSALNVRNTEEDVATETAQNAPSSSATPKQGKP